MMRRSINSLAVLALATISFAVSWAIASAATVDAHSATPPVFIAERWFSGHVPYSFGDLDAPLHTSEARNSIHFGPTPWVGLSQSDITYGYTGVYDNSYTYPYDACLVPTAGIWVYTINIQNTAAARTGRCTTNGYIERGRMAFDDIPSTWAWHLGNSNNVPAGHVDLRGVSVHEFGHAAGFKHFDEAIDDCSGSDRLTMCTKISTGTNWFRSLESHDRHTMELAYPQ